MALRPRQDAHRSPLPRLLAIALLGLVLRLAFGLGYWNGRPLTRDEQEYLSLARSLSAGRGFTYDDAFRANTFLPFGRAPGYPLFLMLTGAGEAPVTSVPTAVKVAQSLIGAVGVILAGLIGARLGGARVATAAALFAACYPPLVWIAAYTFSEALFWPIGLLVVWLADTAYGPAGETVKTTGARRAYAGLAGLTTGAGILIRPALLPFAPLLVFWYLVRRRVAVALLFAASLSIVLVPWTVRNYVHYGRLMIVASDGGVTFWTGNNPLATGEGDMAANPSLELANRALRAEHPGLTEEEMEPIYYREALAWVRAHPMQWIVLEGRKLFLLVVPLGPSYRVHSRLYDLMSVLSYSALLLGAVGGLVRLGPALARTPALWLLLLSAVAICLMFFPQERFRIPIIDPALIVCAAGLAAARNAS